MRKTLFVNVILPLPVRGLFTYRVPYEWNDDIEVGKRVLIQFGKKKMYTGIVETIHEIPPKQEAKYILDILDSFPITNKIQLKFWNWISEYYMCFLGETMNMAIPSGLKLTSETRIYLNKELKLDKKILNDREFQLLNILQIQGSTTVTEMSKLIGITKIIPLINTLIEKEYIHTEENIKERFYPKIKIVVELNKKYFLEDNLKSLFDSLEKRAPKQLALLISYLQNANFFENPKPVERDIILKEVGSANAALKALIKKEIFEENEIIVERITQYKADKYATLPTLTVEQEEAKEKIKSFFENKKPVLLHGVTSSGKTEIYIRLIQEALSQEKQVLYLLPEIALTTQMVERIRMHFGESMGVYHSKYSENERVELWQKVQQSNLPDSPKLILGARSALFLPYNNLGLIIIDEEHDVSYKQYDPAPRYNARDTAIYLAKIHQANIILGSATPSLESYYNAKEGKYGLVELHNRYGNVRLPEIEIIDLKEAHKNRKMDSIFSSSLLEEIELTVNQNQQAILFQNRRGFSLHIHCNICNWVPYCLHCDVSLVYHKADNLMKCHYCGYSVNVPHQCPECKNTAIIMKGFGTEQVEEELNRIFPEISTARMDLDSTRKKLAHQRIIQAFESQKVQVLIGTQMVTKGFDFENVMMVAILSADNLLSYPDFRAFERAYQIMSQIAGRAGRRNKVGKVLIQTFNSNHHILKMVKEQDYNSFYKNQLQEREQFYYPPFVRLVIISVRHTDSIVTNNAADELALLLRKYFNNRVLGPEYPVISRIRNFYIKNIIIKLEKQLPIQKTKNIIQKSIDKTQELSGFKGVRFVVDVDPI